MQRTQRAESLSNSRRVSTTTCGMCRFSAPTAPGYTRCKQPENFSDRFTAIGASAGCDRSPLREMCRKKFFLRFSFRFGNIRSSRTRTRKSRDGFSTLPSIRHLLSRCPLFAKNHRSLSFVSCPRYGRKNLSLSLSLI